MNKSRKQSSLGVSSSISAMRRYADSFTGQSIQEVKRRLARGKAKMDRWKSGKQLVVTFPKYEVRVFFFGDKALLTSIQVLSSGDDA